MTFFYKDKFRIESVEIGLILSVNDFIGLLASWVAGRLSDRAGRKPLIGIRRLLSRVCGFVLPLTDDVTQAGVVLRARSLRFNISISPLRTLQDDRTPQEARGRYFSLFTTGGIISPIIGIYLYNRYRFETLEVAGAVLPR